MNKSFYKVIFSLVVGMAIGIHVQGQITATIDANNTWCGLNNGTAEVYPSGGAGYTYQWSNAGSNSDTIFGLSPGPYSVTVYSGTDSVVKTFNIAASTVPTITITATHDSACLGTGDQLIASSTSAVPIYIWSGGSGTITSPDTAISINVVATQQTNYTYTVTLGSGCPASATYTLVAYQVSATQGIVTQPTCGQNNGAINCTISASHNFQTILLRNDTLVEQGSQTQFTNLAPGTYTFAVTDFPSGCTDTLPAIVLADNSTYPIFTNIQVTPDSCFGRNTGAIAVTLANCAGGCTYRWSQSPSNTTTSATGLPAGMDTFYVSSGGCTNIDTIITVPGPLAPLADSLRAHPDHCGHDVGSAFALTTGGTAPYSYVWSMGNSLGDSVTALVGDSILTLTVTDTYGCHVSDTAFIGNSGSPTATLTPSDTICASESNGLLIVTPTSNDGPFTYSWSNGSNTNVAAGLSPGIYFVSVYNAVGCDTVLVDTVPAYHPQLGAIVTPTIGIPAGAQVEIQLQTNVPVKNVTWSPYISGSVGDLDVGFTAEQTTQYIATVTYGQACQITDTILISVSSDSGSMWTVPNTFTPNGDGINDNFKLIAYPLITSFHIWIYDRWGNKVYDSTDPDFRWNGFDQYAGGQALNTGVFAYVIQYQSVNSDEKKTIGGNISLIK